MGLSLGEPQQILRNCTHTHENTKKGGDRFHRWERGAPMCSRPFVVRACALHKYIAQDNVMPPSLLR